MDQNALSMMVGATESFSRASNYIALFILLAAAFYVVLKLSEFWVKKKRFGGEYE